MFSRWLLILGLAFICFYFGVQTFLHPQDWLRYVPNWIEGWFTFDKRTWLQIAAGSELVVGAMLIFPSFFIRRFGAVLAALFLGAIITQLPWNGYSPLHVALLAMALSVGFMPID